MICPRCGVLNAPGRSACSRCSGLLAPASARDNRPLPPVLPITKRAELTLGRATTAGAAGIGGRRPGPTLGAGLEAPELPVTELYLLAADRSTGQPAPPPAPLGQGEPARADRPGRVAIGLSSA